MIKKLATRAVVLGAVGAAWFVWRGKKICRQCGREFGKYQKECPYCKKQIKQLLREARERIEEIEKLFEGRP